MKIGISELFLGQGVRDGNWTAETARFMEELGYNSIWIPEHVVFFPEYTSTYPYEVGGAEEVNKTIGIMDPLIAAATIATATNRVKIGTYVMIVPQRNPVLTAHQIATVDQVSRGRFQLGAGIGWSEQEYRALDTPFERRGARMGEYLAAYRELWSEKEISSFEGEFVNFEPLYCFPKPYQNRRLPIIVGGNSPAAMRRIVQFGDGWAGYSRTHEDIEKFIEALSREMDAAGRDMSELSLKVGRRSQGKTEKDWEDDLAYIEKAFSLGIDEVVVSPRIGDENYEADMRRFAEIVGVGERS